jgi:hypothetical protein
MNKLYIKEIISKKEQSTMNLSDRVRKKGGHTDAFNEIVQDYHDCEEAMLQRNAFWNEIWGNFVWRIHGASLGSGYAYLCGKTKKLE